MRVTFDWGVSPLFGWGVYGLNLALQWAGNRDIEAATLEPVNRNQLALDPLRLKALQPFLKRSALARVSRRQPGEIVLHALGNELVGAAGDDQDAKIGVIFFEQPLSPAAIERARRYELIITGSTWNEEQLRAHGLSNVKTIFQGVDRSLFHPAPKRGLYPDKFLIFSGGKAEPRKGQDLVVKAFRAFAQRHADAMLVTAWHSPWPQLAAGMDLDLSAFADRVVDVGALPNGQMAPVYRECDVALFPNRAEGGTNLVAMECIACGVPTIVSHNTGHRDLHGQPRVVPLKYQRHAPGQWTEWGESSIDEMVQALEHRHSEWRAGKTFWHTSLKADDFQWSDAANELAAIARAHHERTDHGPRQQAAG